MSCRRSFGVAIERCVDNRVPPPYTRRMATAKDAKLTIQINGFLAALGVPAEMVSADAVQAYRRVFKKNLADKKATRKDYITPPRIVLPLGDYFPGGCIPLDPATTPDNPLNASLCYTEEMDGLILPWGRRAILDISGPDTEHARTVRGIPPAEWGVFVNPPFGDSFTTFLTKISHEAGLGVDILALFPVNRFEQAYLHEAVFSHNPLVCWITERVHFLHPMTREPQKNNTYPSMLVGYNSDEKRFVRAFRSLGTVTRVNALAVCTAAQVKKRQAERRKLRAAARKAAKEAAAALPAPDPNLIAPPGTARAMSPGAIEALSDAAMEGFF